jgi:hypothetical protein
MKATRPLTFTATPERGFLLFSLEKEEESDGTEIPTELLFDERIQSIPVHPRSLTQRGPPFFP